MINGVYVNMCTEMTQEITTCGVPLALSDLQAHIASELAAGLSDPDAIKARYQISDEKWESLRKNPIFRKMVADAIEKFQGDLNAKERIRLKAAIATEDTIVPLYGMVYDESLPAASRIEAQKQLSRMAGTDRSAEDGAGGGGGFKLVINFSDRQHEVNVKDSRRIIDAESTRKEAEG